MTRPAIFALGAGFGSLFVVACMHVAARVAHKHVLDI